MLRPRVVAGFNLTYTSPLSGRTLANESTCVSHLLKEDVERTPFLRTTHREHGSSMKREYLGAGAAAHRLPGEFIR